MHTGSSEASSYQADSSERLDLITDALDGLWRILAGQETLRSALESAVRDVSRAVPNADAVTVTELVGDGAESVAWTDSAYLALDVAQYASDRGPCLEAARTLRPARAVIATAGARWPEFARAARDAGVAACLAVPLTVEANGSDSPPEMAGALNLYSRDTTAFNTFDEALLRLFAAAAAQAVSSARRGQRLREQIRNLQLALCSRAQIDQAKGALMAIHQCSSDEAFTRLVEQSQRRNLKVREVAQDLLDSLLRAT